MKEMHGMSIDPLTEIVICCGQSEAFAAAIFAIIDHGDEVLVFDPSYETYDTCIKLAGGVPVYVGLDPPYWILDPEKLEMAFTDKTKVVVLNRPLLWHSPHNPTGKVFTKDELEVISEVYEHITYDSQSHVSLASLPGMQSRTVITSSLSKTYSTNVGWAIAPPCIASAIRNIHVRLTDCAPVPFQEAALTALRSPPSYFETLGSDYESKRDCILELLIKVVFKPQGSIFVFAELPETCRVFSMAMGVAVGDISDLHSAKVTRRYQKHSAKISELAEGDGRLKIFEHVLRCKF
ncbi:hypothetical protein SASPL_100927 [Salvia splendens]|uniref:Aminotransferase class I/classII large domain-containing protein n=1 Tax=Salvia splendens TaxID=180675 RepID=A0A8X9ACY0_SALSN|nr:hypothetical protein SASPL_100927 [Salvia splendens]